MRFSAVIFDLDGTLIDSLSLILESFRFSLNKIGLSANESEILKTIGLPLREACCVFAGDRSEEVFNCYVEYQDSIHDSYVKEYPGTSDLLKYLKEKNLRVGIVTSKRRKMAERGLKVTGLYKYVDALVTLEDTAAHKPAPEPLFAALALLQVQKKEAVFVGDSPYDIRCGKNAGVCTVGVTWGVTKKEALAAEKPDAIVSKWQDLKDFLER